MTFGFIKPTASQNELVQNPLRAQLEVEAMYRKASRIAKMLNLLLRIRVKVQHLAWVFMEVY
jgi:hypothetical protein